MESGVSTIISFEEIKAILLLIPFGVLYLVLLVPAIRLEKEYY